MKQLGMKLDARLHTTRFKQSTLTQFADMRAQKKGRDILLAFEEDIRIALTKACDFVNDSNALHLAHAAKIVHRKLFGKAKLFAGFSQGCQKESVPSLLLALVNMILEGHTIKNQSEDTLYNSCCTVNRAVVEVQ